MNEIENDIKKIKKIITKKEKKIENEICKYKRIDKLER